MDDGIDDAPALTAAYVGVSVYGAVDIAKESYDIIKYIKMATSSDFGDMFSVVGASAFLPFLPMLPIQLLTNNLLYDLSQTTIPTDEVDAEWLTKPRTWTIGQITRFILFIGPISSFFDFLTFSSC
jgi:Mg2+-importing ATPase